MKVTVNTPQRIMPCSLVGVYRRVAGRTVSIYKVGEVRKTTVSDTSLRNCGLAVNSSVRV
jgi:hypothetical protein